MWRHAHGPLVAIVVLAGGLLACATAPPPPVQTDGAPERDRMHCGRGIRLDPQHMIAAIEDRARENCTSGAAAAGRYGVFRAVLRENEEGEPMLDLEPSGTLNEDDQRCVQFAAADVKQPYVKALRHSSHVAEDAAQPVAFSFELGSRVPIPSARRIVDDPEWPRDAK